MEEEETVRMQLAVLKREEGSLQVAATPEYCTCISHCAFCDTACVRAPSASLRLCVFSRPAA